MESDRKDYLNTLKSQGEYTSLIERHEKMRFFHKIVTLSLALSVSFQASLIASGGFVRAEEMEKASQIALVQVMELMSDPAKRNQALDEHPSGKIVKDQLKAAAGSPENEAAIFQLASEVFSEIALQEKGDTLKIIQRLEKAKASPKEFADSFSPALRAKLEAVARRSSAAMGSRAPAQVPSQGPSLR